MPPPTPPNQQISICHNRNQTKISSISTQDWRKTISHASCFGSCALTTLGEASLLQQICRIRFCQ
ncbi:hypothetical protein SynA1544_02462 [Synechococcus sp. A15-44]|nr:hypothetical protein SynA1544_02462 [Synechococcus sp. A15-44]